MTQRYSWGVIASTSVHLNGTAFGNANSFVDPGDGHLYFYVSNLDATMVDVAQNPHVSFTLSEAEDSAPLCGLSKGKPDPEACAAYASGGTSTDSTTYTEKRHKIAKDSGEGTGPWRWAY